MSDNAIAGYLGKVYLSSDGGGSYVEAVEMKDFKPSRARKTIDSTSHGDNGNESFKSGTKAWTATMDLLYAVGDPVQAMLSGAFEGATKLKVRFDPNGTAAGRARFSGEAIIETLAGPDSPVEGICAQQITFKGTGGTSLVESVQ